MTASPRVRAWLAAHDPEDTAGTAALYLQGDGTCECCGVSFGHLPNEGRTPRWRVVLYDFGSLDGQVEWYSATIADAAWHLNRAWGQWHELPGADGAVLLSDSMTAHLYDSCTMSEGPAWVLMPHEKKARVIRRRPEL